MDIATLFVSYGELVRIPAMNWTLSDKLSVRYDYDEMVSQFFEKDPIRLAGGPIADVLIGIRRTRVSGSL